MLGFYDLKRLGLNLNFTENLLFNNSVSISIFHEVNHTDYRIYSDTSEITAKILPDNLKRSTIISKTKFYDIHFPETSTIAKNGNLTIET